MAVTKTINIDGKDVTFKASAAVPRLYRNKFGRDIYKDLSDLEKAVSESNEEASTLDTFSLELFEDLGYIFCLHADPEHTPASVSDWLEQFNTFSIYQILPEIIELWGMNTKTTADSKKNSRAPNGK